MKDAYDAICAAGMHDAGTIESLTGLLSTACIAAFDWYSETASIEDAANSTNWEAFP